MRVEWSLTGDWRLTGGAVWLSESNEGVVAGGRGEEGAEPEGKAFNLPLDRSFPPSPAIPELRVQSLKEREGFPLCGVWSGWSRCIFI